MPNTNIFHLLTLGLVLGTRWYALGLQGFRDTNMLVLKMLDLVFWWNIGFKLVFHYTLILFCIGK